MEFKKIIIGILVVLFAIVLFQNTQVITVKFLFWEVQMAQILILLLSALLGFAIGYILLHIRGRRKRRG